MDDAGERDDDGSALVDQLLAELAASRPGDTALQPRLVHALTLAVPPALRSALLRHRATYLHDSGVTAELLAVADEGIAVATEQGLPSDLARFCGLAASGAARLDRVDSAGVYAVRALTALDDVDDPAVESDVANLLGIFSYHFFAYDRAIDLYERSLASGLRAGSAGRVSCAEYNIADALLASVQLARQTELAIDAWPRLERARGLAADLSLRGVGYHREGGLCLLVRILCEMGRADEGWALLVEHPVASEDNGSWGARQHAACACQVELGRAGEAAAGYDLVLADLHERDDDTEVLGILWGRSRARELLGDHAGALADERRAAAMLWRRHQRQVSELLESVWVQARLSIDRHALEQAADHDPLTGAGNRRALDRTIAELRTGADVGVLMVDIDHFKTVNDRFGHGVGDAVLSTVVTLMQQSLRGGDRVVRYGGEEFVALLPTARREHTAAAGERVRAAVAAHDWSPIVRGLHVTVSIGAVAGATTDATALIERADAALYDAKRAGRNRVVSVT